MTQQNREQPWERHRRTWEYHGYERMKAAMLIAGMLANRDDVRGGYDDMVANDAWDLLEAVEAEAARRVPGREAK